MHLSVPNSEPVSFKAQLMALGDARNLVDDLTSLDGATVAVFVVDVEEARKAAALFRREVRLTTESAPIPPADSVVTRTRTVDPARSCDRAVVLHLLSLIQGNADVRYHVGGAGTRMRELLVEAIKAAGFEGDPLEVLKPAPHHAEELPRMKKLEKDLDELRAAARAALFGHYEERDAARDRLEALL